MGYMAGALLASWMDDARWRCRLFSATFTVAIVERQPLLAGRGPLARLLLGMALLGALLKD